MTTERKWEGPAWVGRPGRSYQTLSDDDWEYAQTIVKSKVGSLPPPEFRTALNNALVAAEATIYWQEKVSPKTIRYNLRRTRDEALRLNDRLNDLDINSRLLLGEVPGGDIRQLYGLLSTIIQALSLAFQKAREFPTTRAGQLDYASRSMGHELALGMKEHLGKSATSTERGLFAQLYAVLAVVVEVSSDSKAIRAAIRYHKDQL